MKQRTIALLMLLFLAACSTAPSGTDDTADKTTSVDEPARIDLYVMSQCPYGLQVENVMPKVKEELGDAVDINIEYIGQESNGQFNSLHGQPEVKGNMIQLCVKDMARDKVLDFIVCQNKDNPRDLTSSIEKCAEQVGLNASDIIECHEGEKGKTLLSESFARAKEAKASASPTIFINGMPYNAGRDADSFIKISCGLLEGAEACKDIPVCDTSADCIAEPEMEAECKNPGTPEAKCEYTEPTPFELVIVSAKDCENCNVAQLKAALSKAFLGAQVREVMAEDEPELISKNEIVKVPAFLFGEGVKETSAWKEAPELQEAFEPTDFGYKLIDEVTGATHWVSEEAKEEFIADMGITTGDNKPQVDFFVMSYCPFGNVAEEGLAPVSELLGDSVEFKPHYIIYSNYQGGGEKWCYDDEDKYCSMHGVPELTQGVREYIVWQEYGAPKMFEFMMAMNKDCTAKNADECWEDVASGIDIDVDEVKATFDESATDIMKDELDLSKRFGVSASPTVFIDGELYSGQRAPKNYAQAICDAFETAPEECDDLSGLKGASAQSQPAGGCGV